MIECRKCGRMHFRKHYWCGPCHNEYNREHRDKVARKYPKNCSHCGKEHDRKHHYCRECHNEYNRTNAARKKKLRDAAKAKSF